MGGPTGDGPPVAEVQSGVELMESTDGRTWEQRRLQDEIAYSLGDAKQIEDDDDVLNVSLADAARPDSAQVFAFKNARKL